MAIESINPATGETLRSFEALNDEAVQAKVAVAREAFRGFAAVPLEHKTLWMRKLAGILESDADDLAALVTREVGKTVASARLEVLKCAVACRYYATRRRGF